MNRKQEEAKKYRELIARRSFTLESRKLLQRIGLRRRKSGDANAKFDVLLDSVDEMIGGIESVIGSISDDLKSYNDSVDSPQSTIDELDQLGQNLEGRIDDLVELKDEIHQLVKKLDASIEENL